MSKQQQQHTRQELLQQLATSPAVVTARTIALTATTVVVIEKKEIFSLMRSNVISTWKLKWTTASTATIAVTVKWKENL